MSASKRPGRAKAGEAPATAKRPKCPICGKPAVVKYRPFCSGHCADIDLGRWLGGRYAVPGEPLGAKPVDANDGGDDEDEA